MREISSNDTSLSVREQSIVMLRCAGKNVPEIAVELGVGVDTIYRALRRPLVKAALTEARGESIRPHLNLAESHVNHGIDVVVGIMSNPDATDANRIRAATTLLDLYFRLRDVCDVLPRLAALEAMADDPGESI